jgi:hypothetical protein
MYDEPILDDLKLALGALRRVINVLAVWAVLWAIGAGVFYGMVATGTRDVRFRTACRRKLAVRELCRGGALDILRQGYGAHVL